MDKARATIAAVVITKNEERNVEACLRSLTWVDELIVVDAESSDRTVELARHYSPNVFIRPWLGYGLQKNFAMERATASWILIVDADERVSRQLREEILTLLNTEPPLVGYRIPRRNYYCGRWMRGAGQYPDRQLRLVRRGHGRYNDLPVHEHLEVAGPIGDLQGHLDHYSYPTVASHGLKIEAYSTLSSEERVRAGKSRASWYHLLVNPLWTFIKIYLIRGGYRDGFRGFLMSGFSAAHVLLKYAKLWERTNAEPTAQAHGFVISSMKAASTAKKAMMRIGIDANPLLGDTGGIGRLTYQLVRALLELKEDVDFVCYIRPGALHGADRVGWDAGSRLCWIESGRLMMPWRGALDDLDLYHGTNFKIRTKGRYGAVVTVPDLWLDRYPEYSRKLFGQRSSYYRTKRTAWRARRVITISEYSSRDIQSLYGLPQERIVVIPCGVSHDFRPNSDKDALSKLMQRFALPTERYILFVGGADPRKNHRMLLSAYARRAAQLQPYRLVLVGDTADAFGNLMETARAVGIEDRVTCTGRLLLPDLRVLYSHADLFVFPSIYEGFGMPVLEAMACGAPVVTSNTTALPEVAGDAAILVNPHDSEELAHAMVHVLQDSGLRAALRTKGFERARRFTWERAARQTLAVYREVCR